MTIAYIGLGSNVGDRLGHIVAAVRALDDSGGISCTRASAVYETDPVGPPQPDFLNAVVEIDTTLRPHALLARLQAIERDGGRVSREHWGPREIDLDILLYDTTTVSEPGLRIPHPGIPSRSFVLAPLADLDPSIDVPGVGTVSTLLDALGRDGVRVARGPEVLLPVDG